MRTPPVSPNVVWHDAGTERDARWAVVGGRGATVWLTGLSGSGKSTVAVELLALLTRLGVPAYSLGSARSPACSPTPGWWRWSR